MAETRNVEGTVATTSQGAAPAAMAMASSGFEWERLPFDVQEYILLHLPIPTLLLCKSLSRSFLRTIRRPSFLSAYSSLSHRRRRRDNLILLLFVDRRYHGPVTAFLPACSRWLDFHLPSSLIHIHAADGSLLVADAKNIVGDAVSDVFGCTLTRVVPRTPKCYILALIEDEAPASFRIVAIGKKNLFAPSASFSEVYDSRSRRWERRGELPEEYVLLGNAVFLDGLLFVLGRLPDHLLTFDLDSGAWSVVEVEFPPNSNCLQLLVFEGRLFLVGGVEEEWITARIGIWELDLEEKKWWVFSFMPDSILKEFCGEEMVNFEIVDGLGFVCFCNNRKSILVMFDMASKTWSWPPWNDAILKPWTSWLGHALDLPVQLLRT